jgi:hypothetical protein
LTLRIVISNEVNTDPTLKAITDLIKEAKLSKPKKSPPKEEYLKHHRDIEFEKFLKD